MDPAKTTKMIKAYSQNRVIFGDFYRENRFKTLIKEYEWKVKVWTFASVTTGILMFFCRASRCLKGWFLGLWALGSLFMLPMSSELMVVSSELYDKYEKMIETKLPLTKKLSTRKVNKEIKRMFGI
jgi:hypothetical protein